MVLETSFKKLHSKSVFARSMEEVSPEKRRELASSEVRKKEFCMNMYWFTKYLKKTA